MIRCFRVLERRAGKRIRSEACVVRRGPAEADEWRRGRAHLSAILSSEAGSNSPKSPVMITADAFVSSLV